MLKRILVTISFLILFLLPQSVYAATQSEIIQRVDSDIKVANGLLSQVESVQNDAEAAIKVLLQNIPSVTQHWNESSIFYENKISIETDEQLKTILASVNTSVKGLSSSLLSVQNAIEQGDDEAYTSAFEQYDQYIESLNSQIEPLNNHFGVADYSWLAWPFWIALIISIVLFIMSRGSPVLPAEQLRNQFEFALFKSSLWPLGGSAISYIWFLMTPPGGTFYVLWGPIGIGYFQFLRGLHAYITLARPAINIAKKEEKAKLEALIRSDHFQKESMEEQVKEIEKRSGVIKIGKDDSDKDTSKKDADKKDAKYCKDCGTKNTHSANYCKSCGYKF